MKILVIRLSSGGDLILLTGVLKEILDRVENIEIDLLIKKKFASIFEGFPPNLNLLFYEEKIPKLFLKRYDLAFDLHKKPITFFIMKKIKAGKKFFINKRSIRRRAHLYFRIPIEEKSIIRLYAETFEKAFKLNFEQRPFLRGEEEFKSLPDRYVLVAPFGSKKKKDLPPDVLYKFLNFYKRKFNLPFVIVGGKDSLLKNYNFEKEDFVDLRGRTNLKELFFIVKNSDFVITVDSMIAHISSAYRKKGIVIFGPTTPLYGFRPYGNELKVIYNKIFCSPCSLHGECFCPFKKRCYRELVLQ